MKRRELPLVLVLGRGEADVRAPHAVFLALHGGVRQIASFIHRIALRVYCAAFILAARGLLRAIDGANDGASDGETTRRHRTHAPRRSTRSRRDPTPARRTPA